MRGRKVLNILKFGIFLSVLLIFMTNYFNIKKRTEGPIFRKENNAVDCTDGYACKRIGIKSRREDLVASKSMEEEKEPKNDDIRRVAQKLDSKEKHTTIKATIGFVNAYSYRDICPDYDTHNLYWYPLFPDFPHKRYFASKLEDNEIIEGALSRRFLGYLHINKSSFYTFEMLSRDGMSVCLFNDKIREDKIVARFGLNREDMVKQNPRPPKPFRGMSKEIWLDSRIRYVIDVTHTHYIEGKFSLKFKTKEDSKFTSIGSSHLSPLYENNVESIVLPKSFHSNLTSVISQRLNEDPRLGFKKRRQLHSKNFQTGLQNCKYTPSYLFSGKSIDLYYGQKQVKRTLLFPDDNIEFFKADHQVKRLLDGSVAKDVANRVFDKINSANQGRYKLAKIVNVEENAEEGHIKRYFVEIDIKSVADDQIYRFSDYFVRQLPENKLCLPEGYSNWSYNTKIYLVCVVKNQGQWFQYLIRSIENLIEQTNDHLLHLVAVDYKSTDTDIRRLLEKSKLNFTFLEMDGNFSKVRGLNEGVKKIPEKDAVVFVMDLHLQIPNHIFDQVRKHTIKGLMSYCPVLMRLQCGEHPEYTNVKDSRWMDFGYGMISLYKSDWERIGGMNEKLFQFKWGGEDWEFIDRVVLGRLEVVHQRLPGFYHVYHSTAGTWDGSKKF